MAKTTTGLTGATNVFVYSDLNDPVDIVIATDGDLDAAIDKTVQDQLDGYVDGPLTEALEEAESINWDGGDGSMVIDVDTDFSGAAPDATTLDMDVDDLIKTTRDMIDMPLDDDEIIDIVNGLE